MKLNELLNEECDSSYGVILGILNDEFEGVTNASSEITSNEDWYNYIELTFDFKGHKYSIEYREHTSDNVSDEKVYEDSLTCLGEVDALDKVVSQLDIEKVKRDYEQQIKSLKEQHKKEIEQLNKHKELNASLLLQFNMGQLKYAGNFLGEVEESIGNRTLKLTEIGEFLNSLEGLR